LMRKRGLMENGSKHRSCGRKFNNKKEGETNPGLNRKKTLNIRLNGRERGGGSPSKGEASESKF